MFREGTKACIYIWLILFGTALALTFRCFKTFDHTVVFATFTFLSLGLACRGLRVLALVFMAVPLAIFFFLHATGDSWVILYDFEKDRADRVAMGKSVTIIPWKQVLIDTGGKMAFPLEGEGDSVAGPIVIESGENRWKIDYSGNIVLNDFLSAAQLAKVLGMGDAQYGEYNSIKSDLT